MNVTKDQIEMVIDSDYQPVEVINLLDYIVNEAETLGEAQDMINEFIGEYFESQDPKSMGWVGGDGLP